MFSCSHIDYDYILTDGKYVDDTIAELERQILEQEQVKELKFTPEDILIKRDMDFINRVKLPMLYKAIVECWEDLDREEKSRIIMNYIDDIKLTKNSLNLVNRNTKILYYDCTNYFF